MSTIAKNTVGILIACAVVVFAIFAGIALTVHSGQAQTCATSGGHWHATDKALTGAAVDRVRECTR